MHSRDACVPAGRLTGAWLAMFAVLFALLFTATPVMAQHGALFSPVRWSGPAMSPGELAVARSRAVTLDIEQLRAIGPNGGDVRMNLFGDADFHVRFDQVKPRGRNNITLTGHVVGESHSHVLAVIENGVVGVNFWLSDGRLFQVRRIDETQQIYGAQELDPDRYPPCGCGPEHEVAERGGGAAPMQLDSNGEIFDVMVVWTPQARQAAGGLGNIETIAILAVEATSNVYNNSEINAQARLVYRGEVDYVQSGSYSTDLGRLRNTSDGHMDEVHAIRDEYGADLVALLVSDPSLCGIAYLMTNLSPNFASSAFSLTNQSCAVGNLTFAHELGHNMGSAHDHANAGNALFSYSYGHRWTGQSGTLFRTVMAYSPGSRRPHFSNPNVLFDGVPTGIPEGQPDPADNARSINEAASTIAAWRPSVEPILFEYPDGRPATFDCVTGEAFIVQITSRFEETILPGSPTLHVVLPGDTQVLPLVDLGDDLYQLIFPEVDCGTIVSYYLTAETSTAIEVVEPSGGTMSTYQIVAAVDAVLALADDFETDQGWTVTDSPSLTDGTWERGVPIPWEICNRGNPPHDADGSGQAYLTANRATPSCNSDVDDGSTFLTSPLIDATGGEAFVRYWRWFSNTQGANPGVDIFVVEVSNDGGDTWVTLEEVGPTGPEADGGWYQKTFRISDVITPTENFRIRFIASDLGPQAIVEAAVDGVEVFIVTCNQTTLTDASVVFGTHLAGDVQSLLASDEDEYQIRSQFGFTVIEPNLTHLSTRWTTTATEGESMRAFIETRLDMPGGRTRLFFRNWQTNARELVASYQTGTEKVLTEVVDITTANRIRESDGEIEMIVRQSVVASFSLLGFRTYIDYVDLIVE